MLQCDLDKNSNHKNVQIILISLSIFINKKKMSAGKSN